MKLADELSEVANDLMALHYGEPLPPDIPNRLFAVIKELRGAAIPPTTGAGPDKDVYWHFEGSEQDSLDTMHNDVQVVISAGTLKGLLDGSPTTGAGGVPEEWQEHLESAVDGLMPIDPHQIVPATKEEVRKFNALLDTVNALLSTTPGNGEWKPYYEYPEIGKPVLGYHPDWVDEDFCTDGIRECFTFGDGSEWQSAKWDGYSDQWVVEDGAPKLWMHHPQQPVQGGDESE